MTSIDRNQLIDSFFAQRNISAQRVASRGKTSPAPPRETIQPDLFTPKDVRPPETVIQGLAAAQPKLVSESVDNLERGFRRTQIFRQADGRDFSRNEETVLTGRGFKRTVTQHNPSGKAVVFEENLDRLDDGSYRRTQYYTNEAGETQTKIELDLEETGQFILQRQAPSPAQKTAYSSDRGTSLDISV